jgi:hypothetical protein
MNSKSTKTTYRSGFALLFSIVVVSVVVITTLAVSSIVRRGLELTSVGERSMEAFFAADAGLECALYWDIKERAANGRSVLNYGSGGTISCLDPSITVSRSGQVASFSLRNVARDLCSDVTVTVAGLTTTVSSRGYNTCDETDPGRIERGLEARY